MKALRLVIGLLVCLVLISCYNPTDSSREINKLYPESEIYRIEPYRYILIDSTGIYYICDVGIRKSNCSKTLIKKY